MRYLPEKDINKIDEINKDLDNAFSGLVHELKSKPTRQKEDEIKPAKAKEENTKAAEVKGDK
jgi:hypothetical protein